jgi:hypothetical protein
MPFVLCEEGHSQVPTHTHRRPGPPADVVNSCDPVVLVVVCSRGGGGRGG